MRPRVLAAIDAGIRGPAAKIRRRGVRVNAVQVVATSSAARTLHEHIRSTERTGQDTD